MNTDLIEKAKQTDLLSLVGRDTRLHKVATTRGGEFAGPCPFCGGTDRLRVQPECGLWWCRQCGGEHWQDAIAYVMRRDNLDFRGAVSALAGGAALSTTFTPAQPARKPAPAMPAEDWRRSAAAIIEQAQASLWGDAGAKARNWLHARGLSDDTIRVAQLGYIRNPGKRHGLWCEGGIVIPWVAGGKVYKLNVRRPVGEPKYKMVAGSVNGALYLADKMRGLPDVLIVEGELDALLCWQEAGDFADMLTLGSATGRIAPAWLPYLLAAKRFWLCLDADADGERAAVYWHDLVGERGRRIYAPSGAKDVTEAWQAGAVLADWLTGVMGLGAATVAYYKCEAAWARGDVAGAEHWAVEMKRCADMM